MLQEIKRITDLLSLNNTKYRKFSLRLRWVQSSTFPGQKKKPENIRIIQEQKTVVTSVLQVLQPNFLWKKCMIL